MVSCVVIRRWNSYYLACGFSGTLQPEKKGEKAHFVSSVEPRNWLDSLEEAIVWARLTYGDVPIYYNGLIWPFIKEVYRVSDLTDEKQFQEI